MPNYMEPLFEKHEQIARSQVQFETWGHLYPEPGTTYKGTIDIAFSGSDYLVIDWDIKNEHEHELDNSPVQYEDMNDFACDLTCDRAPYNTYEFHPDEKDGMWRFQIEYTRPNDGNEGYVTTIIGEPQKASFG